MQMNFKGGESKSILQGANMTALWCSISWAVRFAKSGLTTSFGLTEEQVRTNVLLKECIASLISALPEMYQACKASLEYLTDRDSRVELGERAVELLRNVLARISNPI